MLRYLTEIEGLDRLALVALVFDDAGELAGVSWFVRDAEDPARAEVALVLADEFKDAERGAAFGLLLADAARARGIDRFTPRLLSDTPVAERLLDRVSDHLERGGDADGTRDLVASIAA
jgi:hypothetical protein